ncbi:MAG: hypothetical protein ACHBN1_24270 [Heteroscytonema crispum UTEX LB 1556]
MVSELHAKGFQRLRIAPGMSPSGIYWRCSIVPIANIVPGHGAIAFPGTLLKAKYTSGANENYFDWKDAANLTPSQLADMFIERFPEIAEAGKGSDEAYAQWYSEMLELTHPDVFPIAYADWNLTKDYLETVGGRNIRVPLPPIPSKAI